MSNTTNTIVILRRNSKLRLQVQFLSLRTITKKGIVGHFDRAGTYSSESRGSGGAGDAREAWDAIFTITTWKTLGEEDNTVRILLF